MMVVMLLQSFYSSSSGKTFLVSLAEQVAPVPAFRSPCRGSEGNTRTGGKI